MTKKTIRVNDKNGWKIVKFGKGIKPRLQDDLAELWSKYWEPTLGDEE